MCGHSIKPKSSNKKEKDKTDDTKSEKNPQPQRISHLKWPVACHVFTKACLFEVILAEKGDV